uniref:Carboxylesterase type B domain-containing protein n=1 Tax=Oryzias sinensis TaxID=183150 RepID=A0A8C7X814_9TELE
YLKIHHHDVSEDCLYLNIFVPRSVDFSKPVQRPLPVMVWIHGGDFIAGSASKPIYDGRFISNFTNTVILMHQPRGIMGFWTSRWPFFGSSRTLLCLEATLVRQDSIQMHNH